MSKTLILMQGIPASGKSTVARAIAVVSENSIVLSADEFWYDTNGRYVYVTEHAGQAHAWNQRRCVAAMQSDEYDTVIIDNTNTVQKEAEPYFALARMYDFEIQVVSIQTPYEICIARNDYRKTDRQVPHDVMRRMYNRMEVLNV